jgi:hypothetical protein
LVEHALIQEKQRRQGLPMGGDGDAALAGKPGQERLGLRRPAEDPNEARAALFSRVPARA